MANSVYDYLVSEASSSATGGWNTAENQDPSTVNDGQRQHKQNLAAYLLDQGASNTVTGTGDAIALATSQPFTAYGTSAGQIKNGVVLRFIAGAANTTNVTLNINGIGTKKLRKISGGVDVALVAGDLAAGETYTVRYSTAADSGTGAWIIMGAAAIAAASTTDVLTGTDAVKSATPDAIAALWEKGTAVASASTVSLGEGGFFHITGTTTITDIDFATAKDGRSAWLEFDGILTLTHNATTLVLPGGANIVTAAGDRAFVVQDSSDNVHVMVYQRAAVLGGADVSTLYVREEQTDGTSGGSFTTGAWRTRTLNTVVKNTISNASLSSNQITLPAGSYEVTARGAARSTNAHKIKFVNVTDTADVVIGSNASAATSTSESDSFIRDYPFTITGSKTFELQHQCNTSGSYGLQCSFGVTEVYAEVWIKRVK